MSESTNNLIADLTAQRANVVQTLDGAIDQMIRSLEAVREAPDLGWGSIGGTAYGQVVALAAQAATLKDQLRLAQYRLIDGY